MFDFLLHPSEQLSSSQFFLLLLVWGLSTSLVMTFFDSVVSFICKKIRGIRKNDKNGQ